MNLTWTALLIFHFLFLPIHLLLTVILFLYKNLVCLSANLFQDFVGPIPSMNCVFIADQIWTKPHSSIVCAIELKGHLSKQQAVEQCWQYAYYLRDKKNSRCFRELGYTPVFYGGYGFWKQIRNFDISDQVHVLESHYTSDKQQEAFLLSFVENLQRKSYERNQPLWEAHLLHNYKGQQNRTLMIIRYHHMMADGASFVKLFYAITGKKELPPQFTKPALSIEQWKKINTLGKKCLSLLNFIAVGYVDYIYSVIVQKDGHSLHFYENGQIKCTNNWICSIGKSLDINLLIKACKFYQCGVTDMLVAGMTKGVENYMAKYHNVPEEFHYSTTLPIPDHPNLRLVNHWCITKLAAKTGIRDISAIIKYVKQERLRCFASNLPVASATVFQYGCSLFPAPLADLMTKSRGTNTLIYTNIVGPQDKRTLFCSMPVSNIVFWLPIVQQMSAMAIGAISCNGNLTYTITADVGYIPTREKLYELTGMINDQIMAICQFNS